MPNRLLHTLMHTHTHKYTVGARFKHAQRTVRGKSLRETGRSDDFDVGKCYRFSFPQVHRAALVRLQCICQPIRMLMKRAHSSHERAIRLFVGILICVFAIATYIYYRKIEDAPAHCRCYCLEIRLTAYLSGKCDNVELNSENKSKVNNKQPKLTKIKYFVIKRNYYFLSVTDNLLSRVDKKTIN